MTATKDMLDDVAEQLAGLPPNDRVRRWRELIDEYEGVDSEEWNYEAAPLEPPNRRRFVLIETNQRGSSPPYWLTMWDDPNAAACYTVEQEYAEDWDATTLIDLDSGTLYSIETTARAVSIP